MQGLNWYLNYSLWLHGGTDHFQRGQPDLVTSLLQASIKLHPAGCARLCLASDEVGCASVCC